MIDTLPMVSRSCLPQLWEDENGSQPDATNVETGSLATPEITRSN